MFREKVNLKIFVKQQTTCKMKALGHLPLGQHEVQVSCKDKEKCDLILNNLA